MRSNLYTSEIALHFLRCGTIKLFCKATFIAVILSILNRCNPSQIFQKHKCLDFLYYIFFVLFIEIFILIFLIQIECGANEAWLLLSKLLMTCEARGFNLRSKWHRVTGYFFHCNYINYHNYVNYDNCLRYF